MLNKSIAQEGYFRIIALSLFLMLIMVMPVDRIWATSVPTHLAFQGLLKDTSGAPVTGAARARFGIYVGGARVWYAEYTSIVCLNGYFDISLGSAPQGGVALDPVSGDASTGALALSADIFSALTSCRSSQRRFHHRSPQ